LLNGKNISENNANNLLSQGMFVTLWNELNCWLQELMLTEKLWLKSPKLSINSLKQLVISEELCTHSQYYIQHLIIHCLELFPSCCGHVSLVSPNLIINPVRMNAGICSLIGASYSTQHRTQQTRMLKSWWIPIEINQWA
jgi:hypothetical protein